MMKYSQKENFSYVDSQGPEYADYKNYMIKEFGQIADYKYGKKLGSGHYANVYKSKNLKTDETVVIKNLNAINISKIKREQHILKRVSEGPNIVKLLDTVPLNNKTAPAQSNNHKFLFAFDGETLPTPKKAKKARAAYIFEYSSANTVHKSERFMTDYDIRCTIYDTLKAMAFSHSKGIMHRDLKPGNILYNLHDKSTKVLDFGLAEYFLQSKSYHYRVATKTYKAPELLLNYTCYDYNMDTWGIGVTMAQLIFRKRPLFGGKDDRIVLRTIVKQFGTQKMIDFLRSLDLTMDQFTAEVFTVEQPAREWSFYETKANKVFTSPEAYDLLDKLMAFDFRQRISPQDALGHPYFDPIRDFREGRNTTSVDFQNIQEDSETEEGYTEDDDDDDDVIQAQDNMKNNEGYKKAEELFKGGKFKRNRQQKEGEQDMNSEEYRKAREEKARIQKEKIAAYKARAKNMGEKKRDQAKGSYRNRKQANKAKKEDL